MQTLEYRTIDKSAWGAGPWQREPDKKQWQDPETGLPCLAVRGLGGYWCGYVGVPPEHPWHGRDYDDADVEVHGGLIFAAGCGHGKDEAEGVCHRPDAGEPDDVWWFGFDCAHFGDRSPGQGHHLCLPDYAVVSAGVYRDLDYVESQVAGLARQLFAVSSDDPALRRCRDDGEFER